jgi:pimeloyl-ACP methyl ester carboxylesterase
MPMTLRHLSCLGAHGWFRVAYAEWAGPIGAPAVVCVHGLTRNGRDFDRLADALSRRYRVVAPDMPGRGKSDWVPAEQYGYPLYLTVCAALLARLDIESVDWVGTSMGGLIGMLMAAQPNTPIRRLVVNDVGPLVAKPALERIASYVGQDPAFASVEEIEAYLRRVHAPFGPLSDAEWRVLAEHSWRRKPEGGLGLAYDPAIGNAFKGKLDDVDLWSVWDQIKAPTLALRGEESDLLRAADAQAMAGRGPRARLVEFSGVGQAPALMAEDQIASVEAFLDAA